MANEDLKEQLIKERERNSIIRERIQLQQDIEKERQFRNDNSWFNKLWKNIFGN